MPSYQRLQAVPRLTDALDTPELHDDPLIPRRQPSPALPRTSSSRATRIHTVYRADSYRIPGQRHPTIVAASFVLKETPGGAIIDLMSSHPTLCGRILTRFEEEAAALNAPESVRRLAVNKARFYLCDRGLQRLRTEVQGMASATSHRAFCSCAPRRIPCTGRGVPSNALRARASLAISPRPAHTRRPAQHDHVR